MLRVLVLRHSHLLRHLHCAMTILTEGRIFTGLFVLRQDVVTHRPS